MIRKKSDGYSLKDGKKSMKTTELFVMDGALFSTTIPFLEFSIEFQPNNPIYERGTVNDNK